MLRLICGIAVIAYIFAHSSERPPSPMSDDAARWLDGVGRGVAEAALRSHAAKDLVGLHAASTSKAGARSER